ncbi:DUF6252 family protein [Hymenobacter sp. BRD128]|uniref:DUF6252 family protein n=1 Tax=Hymenobacter sp. BRD128 TaxID=2675878 RepID=UPI0020B7B81C|nr:DUF6252 family protein [Hymenobacter sp. BRD128]
MKKLFFSGILLFAVACHQKDPTPSGPNTFSCQIEGRDFTPYIAPTLFVTPPKALETGSYNRRGGLVIEARTSFDELTIWLLAARSPGTYQLGKGTPYWKPSGNYATYTSTPPAPASGPLLPISYYFTDSAAVGTVTLIRYDTVAHVASGTFSYTAREITTGKLAHLTNGRFDVAL